MAWGGRWQQQQQHGASNLGPPPPSGDIGRDPGGPSCRVQQKADESRPVPPVSRTWPGLTREREAVTSEVSDPARLTVSGVRVDRSTAMAPLERRWRERQAFTDQLPRPPASATLERRPRQESAPHAVGCPRSMIPASV